MALFDPRTRQANRSAAIGLALYRVTQAITILLRQAGQAHGLSPAQVQALTFLAYGRPGVRTVSGLAQRLRCTLATASGIASALERKGLLCRRQGRGRTVFLDLTPEGQRRVRQLEDALSDLEAVVDSLPEDAQGTLHTALQTIVRRLAERGLVVVYEMCWECAFFRPHAHPDNPEAPHHCAFMDAPLPEADTYTECPDFVPREEVPS